MSGRVGRFWTIAENKPQHVHQIAWKAAAQSTRKKHRLWLLRIKEMPQDLLDKPLDQALIELILRLAKDRKWAWSTVASAFSDVEMALRNLPLHTTNTNSIQLKSAEFAAAKNRAQKLARITATGENLSRPLTEKTMKQMAKSISDPSTRILLQVAWSFAARIGDMINVRARDVKFPNNNRNLPTTITFREGKGAAFWGPFTISAVLNKEIEKDLAELAAHSGGGKIWSDRDRRQLASAMKSAGLNLRSIRRGALLHMAERGVEDEDIQLLSGHKRKDTLLRYLGWGTASSTANKAAIRRANLAGAGATEPKLMGPFSGSNGTKGRRISKPPSFFWQRPPSTEALGLSEEKIFPLHLKDVGLVNRKEVLAMAKGTPYDKDVQDAYRWLWDPSKYTAALPRPMKKVPKIAFNEEQIRAIVARKKLEETKEPKNYINMFGVTETTKERTRIIAEPWLNRTLKEGDYPRLSYPSRLERRAQVLGKNYVAEFDFAAYFDQFELEKRVRQFYVGRAGKRLMQLTRLPMGGKYSAAIAQYTTWVLVYPLTRINGVEVTTMIDNVRIAADSEKHFEEAVGVFLKRVKKAGITMNEHPFTQDHRNQWTKIGADNKKGPFTFLGEVYEGDSIRNSPKSVTKLREAIRRIDEGKVTRRQLAATVGLALFMAHTLNIPLNEHQPLMKAYANLFRATSGWDETISVLDARLRSKLDNLAKPLLENKAVKIRPLTDPALVARYTCVFDASKTAWAAHLFDHETKRSWRLMHAFKPPLRHSAHAEPTAAAEILRTVREKFPPGNIKMVTDHIALVAGQRRWWSGNGGASTSFFINRAFQEAGNNATFFHVKGVRNQTDADSRSTAAARAKRIEIHEVDDLILESPVTGGLERPVPKGY